MTHAKPTPGRRMTDKAVIDVASQAVRLEQMQGAHDLLQLSVKNAIENMSSTLQSVQAETRNVTTQITKLARSQDEAAHDRKAMDRLEQSIVELREELRRGFASKDETDRAWRESFERSRDEWRTRHEAENENAEVDLCKSIQHVKDTVRSTRSWALGAGALLGVLTVVAVTFLDYRFDEAKENHSVLQRTVEYNRSQIDLEKEKRHQIELYLARGGNRTGDPFNPTAEEKTR